MPKEKGTCYFCEHSYKYVNDLPRGYPIEDNRGKYIYKCNDCGKSFCYFETPYMDEKYGFECGNVSSWKTKFKYKITLCGICFILKDGMKDEWLKVNGKIYEGLTGSNTKSSNKN